MTLMEGDSANSALDVTVLLLDEGDGSTALGPLEIFRVAGVAWPQLTGGPIRPRFRGHSASIGGRPVRTNGNVEIHPEHAIERITSTDLVFVPSSGMDLDVSLRRNAAVVAFLRRVHAAGGRIAGACSGVALLAAAGLLDGKAATSHWAFVPLYRKRFPKVIWQPEALITEAGRVTCGGGGHAALDLALHLVERLCDRATALECSRALVIDMPRPGQSGFALMPLGRPHGDEPVRRAEELIRRRYADPLSFETLASDIGMSPRNFIRRFKQATGIPPLDYLQRLRVHAARRLLEEDRVGVQEAARAVGYSDPAFFRTVFKRHAGSSPAAYRRRFAAPSIVDLGELARPRSRATAAKPRSGGGGRPRRRARRA